jgi:hypothetical protein
MFSVDLPQKNEVKYLGMHLDGRLTLARHIKNQRNRSNRKQTNAMATRKVSTINRKLTLLIRAIWTYVIQLSETASNSNIEIPQRFQTKTLRFIPNTSLYIKNHRINKDLQMNTVLCEIDKWNTINLRKLENHTNALVVILLDNILATHTPKSYTVLTLPDTPMKNPNKIITIISK